MNCPGTPEERNPEQKERLRETEKYDESTERRRGTRGEVREKKREERKGFC